LAFKLKTGKTVNKVLAGAGIVALGGLVLNQVMPGFMQGTLGKAVLPALSFGVGGIESAAGAIVTEMVGSGARAFTGPSAMVNVETESL
jgi:hypothetical protein